MIRIPKGTLGEIRWNGAEWWEYRTRRDIAAPTIRPQTDDNYLIVVAGPWEFMVHTRHVQRDYEPIDERDRFGTFNRTILGRNGRGASRRRTTKRALK